MSWRIPDEAPWEAKAAKQGPDYDKIARMEREIYGKALDDAEAPESAQEGDQS